MNTTTNVWETIPTKDAPNWAKSPTGWRMHQLLLQKLAKHLEEQGVRVELPVEVPGRNHDNGIDLYIGEDRVAIDLKSFWLRKDRLTYTWFSRFHAYTEGRRATWDGKETVYYIHADLTVPVDQWLVARATGLKKSKFTGFAPYYYRKDVQKLSTLVETL